MKRNMIGLIGTTAVAMALTACGGGNPLDNGNSTSSSSNQIVVGSANFPESRLIAEIYAAALKSKGISVDEKLNIGSRETYVPALKDGSIDLIPDYTGNLLQYFDKNSKATAANEVYADLPKALPDGLSVLDKSPAEDKDSVVVTKATAGKYNLKSISDLTAHCADLTMGGPPEFQTRTDGLPGLKTKYSCTFKTFKALDTAGPLTVSALKSGDVDAADLFSTDSSIAANDFVVLEDPKNNFAAQNVVPLINTKKATDAVKSVLNAVSAKLTTAILTELNAKVAGPDHPDASKVASDWLKSVGI